MSLEFCDEIQSTLFQECCTKTQTRLVDIRKLAATVGIEIYRALIRLHTYTGCDTVRTFAGHGKTSALKSLISNKEAQDTFLELGQEWDPSLELMDKEEAFTCLLNAPKILSTKVNELSNSDICKRHMLFVFPSLILPCS